MKLEKWPHFKQNFQVPSPITNMIVGFQPILTSAIPLYTRRNFLTQFMVIHTNFGFFGVKKKTFNVRSLSLGVETELCE